MRKEYSLIKAILLGNYIEDGKNVCLVWFGFVTKLLPEEDVSKILTEDFSSNQFTKFIFEKLSCIIALHLVV